MSVHAKCPGDCDVTEVLLEFYAGAYNRRRDSERAKDWLWEATYKGEMHAYKKAIELLRSRVSVREGM